MNRLPKCKCKECAYYKQTFVPKNNNALQKYCLRTDVCIRAYALFANSEKNKKKAWRKEKAEVKEKLKTKKDYLKDLQEVFNEFIRLRDKDLPCISCGKESNRYDAGHFYHSNYSFLRFEEDNVHKQCSFNCNKSLHGNLSEYRPRLIEKIGIIRFEWLEQNRHRKLELTIPEIKEKIIHYKQKINQLKNSL